MTSEHSGCDNNILEMLNTGLKAATLYSWYARLSR